MSDFPELVKYSYVRRALGLDTNFSFYEAIQTGRLVRVQTSKSLKSLKFTKDSADAYIRERLAEASDADYLKKAKSEGERLHRARRLKLPDASEPLIDPETVCETHYSGRTAQPKQKPLSLDDAIAARGNPTED